MQKFKPSQQPNMRSLIEVLQSAKITADDIESAIALVSTNNELHQLLNASDD